ncbi:MAG: hemolysin III family protein, partial [Psychrosphaera sp.]|nr:hemolysin III family protein [Psychrosphaera sp.]
MDNRLKPTPSFTAAQINKEEWINSITHGIGVIASIVGLVFLLRPSGETLTLAQWGSYAIYGSSLILLFLASTIYHGVQKQRLKRIFKMVDHCAIYLLIAGSYTPLLLLTIGGELADIVLWVIWSVAVVGILFKLKFGSRF